VLGKDCTRHPSRLARNIYIQNAVKEVMYCDGYPVRMSFYNTASLRVQYGSPGCFDQGFFLLMYVLSSPNYPADVSSDFALCAVNGLFQSLEWL